MKCNTDAVYKKGQKRLYFLRMLRLFIVHHKIVHIFNKSWVDSAFCFAATCWGISIRASDLKKLGKLIMKACPVLGIALEHQGCAKNNPA